MKKIQFHRHHIHIIMMIYVCMHVHVTIKYFYKDETNQTDSILALTWASLIAKLMLNEYQYKFAVVVIIHGVFHENSSIFSLVLCYTHV